MKNFQEGDLIRFDPDFPRNRDLVADSIPAGDCMSRGYYYLKLRGRTLKVVIPYTYSVRVMDVESGESIPYNWDDVRFVLAEEGWQQRSLF